MPEPQTVSLAMPCLRTLPGTMKLLTAARQLTMSVWGNGYYHVDWAGHRFAAYWDQANNTLRLYDGDPRTVAPRWHYLRGTDGSFTYSGQDGQVQVLRPLQ